MPLSAYFMSRRPSPNYFGRSIARAASALGIPIPSTWMKIPLRNGPDVKGVVDRNAERRGRQPAAVDVASEETGRDGLEHANGRAVHTGYTEGQSHSWTLIATFISTFI
jgi:hypothetical protein